MVPASPAEAFGSHARVVRALAVDVARARHARAAEAHEVSGSRYALGFGSQWRDLQDDVNDVLRRHGYGTHTLRPAGHRISVVNGALLYPWRVPGTAGGVSTFASSPTRVRAFSELPELVLFEREFSGADTETSADALEEGELEQVARSAENDVMPLVLLIVRSTPRHLHSIEWAVATLDTETRDVTLHGRETLWEPEMITGAPAANVESFDSGTPTGPTIEPQEQEQTPPDA